MASTGPDTRATTDYREALADPAVEAVDTFADELAAVFAGHDPQSRGVVRLALGAFIDGWQASYDDRYRAGKEEGRNIERLGLRDSPPPAA